jgi:hypothetical protein
MFWLSSRLPRSRNVLGSLLMRDQRPSGSQARLSDYRLQGPTPETRGSVLHCGDEPRRIISGYSASVPAAAPMERRYGVT